MPWLGDAVSLVDAFRNKELSPREALDDCLAAIEASDLNTFSHVAADEARAAADAADVSLPFGGVPIGVKELTAVEGGRTPTRAWRSRTASPTTTRRWWRGCAQRLALTARPRVPRRRRRSLDRRLHPRHAARPSHGRLQRAVGGDDRQTLTSPTENSLALRPGRLSRTGAAASDPHLRVLEVRSLHTQAPRIPPRISV